MKRTRKIVYVLEAVFVFTLMALLTSIAVPKIGDMIEQDRNDMRSEELHDIETAVAEMLSESTVKTLQSTGLVRDISIVQTNDSPPLFLSDYLDIEEMQSSDLGCSYSFTADGEVIQECP